MAMAIFHDLQQVVALALRYRESKSDTWQTRTVSGKECIRLLLQHCLPKGFRRARDYGYLQGNAK